MTSGALPVRLNDSIPAISLQFDGDYLTTYAAYQYAAARGVPATVYIQTNQIGTDGYMTADHLREMSDGGWDIANHTISHPYLSLQSKAEQIAQLAGAAAALDGWGLSRASRHVAYPYGNYDAVTLEAMTEAGMLTGRMAGSDNAARLIMSDIDWYEIPCRVIDNQDTVAQMREYIEAAICAGKLVLIYTHRLPDDNPDTFEWYWSHWCDLVDYIASTNAVKLTISQLHTLKTSTLDYSGSYFGGWS